MLQDYKGKTCCVIDNGLFVGLAQTLSEYFGKVYYYSPWRGPFVKSNSRLTGVGVPGIIKIYDYWKVLDEVDLWIFPDIYWGDLQVYLESLGKRVWGTRYGETLELDRKETKKYFKEIGIPIGKYRVITGIDKLRDFLKDNDDQWVKTSLTRGDFETFHSVNYKNIEPKLDELEYNLGAKKNIYEFIVEEGIPGAVEVGYDGYTVDGEFPTKAMSGCEIKDKAYIGVFQDYQDMPQQMIDINSKLSETLKKYRYRNFFCAEIRIKNGDPFVIDPMTRMGSPPGELIQVMYTNLPDIFWYGAEGKCIDPTPSGKYGAELLIYSSWADKSWQAIQFPPALKDNIKFRSLTVIKGEYYVVPQSVGLPEIGAVVAVGDTLKEAVDTVKEYAKHIEGYYIDMFPESLDEAEVEMGKL